MKIGYLFSRYPVPSQTFCDTEMRALEERGHEIEIYSCSPPTTSFRHDAGGRPRGPVFYAPPPQGLELVRLEALAQGTWPAALVAEHAARFGPRYEPARRALHAAAFAERLQRRGVEHLHVHFANRATHAALFVHALTGLPFSFTAHAQDFLVDLGSDALLQEMCARAAFVVTVSDYSQRALIEKCPAAAGKIHRIYNGLPLEGWPPALPVVAGPAAPLRIFSAGRLIDFKGFDDLIAACALLRGRGVPFHCAIAGEGPSRLSLERQIAGRQLHAQVQLLGLLPRAEIRAQLAACDVFALASRIDAHGSCDVLPTVILEAMAAGRPVVSTRLAGIPEMVADGRTGLLVSPGDQGALAEAFAALADDPPLRTRLGLAGRASLEETFSAGSASAKLESLILAARPANPPPLARRSAPASELLLLLNAWPPPDAAPLPLLPLCQALPGVRLLALSAGAGLAKSLPGPEVLSLAGSCEFLPDAIVLEAEWREQPAAAHRLEAWRGSLGAGVATDDFLHAARRALYLHSRWLTEPPVRHVHAVGPAALLCAWLLIRLDPARQASFLLPAPRDDLLATAVLRRLAPLFAGGWLPGAPRLAAELGAAFHSPELSAQAEGWAVWQTSLVQWAAPPRL